MKKTHLITIDPQVDFCDPKGALFVTGADQDMNRLAAFINANQKRIAEIHCTLDSHQVIHIAHPIFWVNSRGENPSPFTKILDVDVRAGLWRPFHPALQDHAQNYVDTLKKNGRYDLTIWPPHCLIGTRGHTVSPLVADALMAWEIATLSRVNYITKGSNFLTEHYSGLMADVPDDGDATTKLNTELIKTLVEADEILITGEALSHCVANTIRDIANNFGNDNVRKFVLLEDTTSPVPVGDGPKMAQDFLKEMVGRGMRLAKSTNW